MPSLYTHQMIAKRAFNKMGKPNYIKNNFNEFLLGSLGLEIFNYHKLLKIFQNSQLGQAASSLKYAKHKDFLLTLIEYSKGDVKHMVYVLGFMTNYASDRTIRPYIHSRTERPEGGGDIVKQTEFEQALDAYLYREEELETTVEQAEFLYKIRRKQVRHIAGLLSSTSRSVMPEIRVWRKSIVDAIEDTRDFTQRINEGRNDAKKKMKLYEAMIGKVGMITQYVPPNIIQGNDIFNFAHRTWRAPFALHTARSESITDLINESLELSLKIINQINDYYIEECDLEQIENIIGKYNFNGREMV